MPEPCDRVPLLVGQLKIIDCVGEDEFKLGCTNCGESNLRKVTLTRHPLLKVAICTVCLSDYNKTEWELDADGDETSCRWCGQGGALLMCDAPTNRCKNSFCEECLSNNLGSSNYKKIKKMDHWRCLVCDPSPLSALVKKYADHEKKLLRQSSKARGELIPSEPKDTKKRKQTKEANHQRKRAKKNNSVDEDSEARPEKKTGSGASSGTSSSDASDIDDDDSSSDSDSDDSDRLKKKPKKKSKAELAAEKKLAGSSEIYLDYLEHSCVWNARLRYI
jgi:hypothetical protein